MPLVADPAARDDILAAVDRVLAGEARRNELIVAYLRVGGLTLFAVGSWAVWWIPDLVALPPMPLYRVVYPTLWLGFGLAVLAVLRHRASPRWVAPTIAFLDASAIALNHILFSSTLPPPIHPVQTTRTLLIACALLAMSGGLRLDRRVAAWITLLAMAAFLAGVRLSPMPEEMLYSLFSAALLLIVGAVGIWMADTVRRAALADAGRATLGRFLPRRVIEGAWGDPAELLAEPRQLDATVLMSDLRGFTSLAEALSPAEVLAFLNTVQGAFAAAVEARGGTVDKFLGDGMLAVFGAPDPLDDHAARALGAARDIQAVMAAINLDRAQRGDPAVRVGVGLHSGSVVTGVLGSGARLEFTVIGDTVNVASRLQTMTRERDADVLASADTVARAGDAAGQVVSLGAVPVRGRALPLEVFAVR
jgi:class 3 adenylate cyclase